ncbi:MAG TPA: monovalent cation/H+ antiporter complex subunit F [Candidatus Limnocylindria bacterium]|jgi:multicomponent Na+:H+ antiporter subunit F|nr:monovalent cation/H+ antiporter complex subunit F [Deltaproteobacteria bacterium]MDH3382836.1 monovalent cation/H+ antiporter complex subunit F [Deltaproteobacteria bacterium]HSL99971.1 monovalent cation/H+ antiporter complex subunit F [Candidatus Limnocylindria bacterium]
MDTFFLPYTIVLTVIIFLPLYRVVRGPTIFDRMLGAGAVGTKTMVLILAIGFLFDRLDMFVDISLAYAVLNFIGTIAIAKFLGTEKAEE